MPVVKNFADLDLKKTYTYSDYLLFQFKERVEIIKGFIYKMSPTPNTNHQRISQNLNGLFYNFFAKKSCSVFVAPFDVRLPVTSPKKKATIVQPDISIICDESILDEKGCNGSPDLIVEILSPSNNKHDIHTKFNLYQECGVNEYWIIEPLEKIVLIYSLKNGEYIGLKPFTEGEKIKSILFPTIDFAVEDLFYKVN